MDSSTPHLNTLPSETAAPPRASLPPELRKLIAQLLPEACIVYGSSGLSVGHPGVGMVFLRFDTPVSIAKEFLENILLL